MVSAIRKSSRWDLLNTTALLRTPGQGLSALQVLQEVWAPQTRQQQPAPHLPSGPGHQDFSAVGSGHVSPPGRGYENLDYTGLPAL